MSSVSQNSTQLVDAAIAELTDASIGLELFAVANVLEIEKSLRRNLADSGVTVAQRQAVVEQVLSGKISSSSLDVVNIAVGQRWSTDADLISGLERAGALIQLASAEQAGAVDIVEEEIFRFARLVDSDAALQMALSNPATTAQAKSELVRDLLSGRAHTVTVDLVSQYVSHRRARRISVALDELSALAATRRGRVVATVTSAVALSDSQKQRLAAALAGIYQREILIDDVVDASVIGGIHVDVAGETIDGTIATRLSQAKRQLLA